MCGSVTNLFLCYVYQMYVCLVFWLNYYFAACGALGVLFWVRNSLDPRNIKKFVSHRQFAGSAVSARLQKYLKAAAINAGETPHSFCVGTLYSGADFPVRGLAKHRNCLVLHAPLQCFYFFAVARTGYTQSQFCGLSARPATR